jgi:macrolide-specific efflux system membrane fusion protein
VSVTTGTVRASVSTTGTLTPADQEDVSFSSAARITSVRVSQGDKVTKGQVLGTIDTLSLNYTLAQAKATLADAKATLASAEDDDSTTSAQRAADQDAVSTAEAAVGAAQTALAGATLRSPISGTVADVNVATGEIAAGSGSSSSGSSTGSSGGGSGSGSDAGSGSGNGSGGGSGLDAGSDAGSGTGSTGTATSSSSAGDFVIVGMKKWTVSATVDDTEIGLIAKNDEAQITTDNVTGTIFGIVTSVSVLSSSSSGAASYPVTITVTGSPSGLHDGASATVAIIYKQATNVLTVPALAVHRDTSGSYVYVAHNGKRTKTTVHTGLSSGGTTQITSGLTSDQQVYVETVTPSRTGGTGSTNSNNRNGGYFPGGDNFPGGGNFPGAGGNFPGGGNR